MEQRSDLDHVVETILVDAYGDDEHYAAFLAVLEEECPVPAVATLLGIPVTVTHFRYTAPTRGLVAKCRGPQEVGEVCLADSPFHRKLSPPGSTPPTAITWACSRSRSGHARTGPGQHERV